MKILRKLKEKISTKIISIFVFFALFVPFATFAYVDEGVVLWTSSGNIMSRTDSEITGSLGGATTAIAGVDAKFMHIVSAPNKKEFILALQDSGGTLRVYHSSDAVNWVADWTATVGDSNVARYDVAYEQNSASAIVAYRNTAANNSFTYRVWNGSSWASAKNQATGYSPNSQVAAIRLASRPGTDQIGMVWLSDNRAGSAGFWGGSSWSMFGTAITTNGTVYGGFSGTYPPMRNADIAFESQSGAMMAGIGQNDSSHVRYVIRSSTGSWGAVTNISGLSGYGDYMRLEPSPTTDEIAFGSCMMEPSSSSYLCDFDMWSGSSWGTVSTVNPTGPTVNGDVPADVVWLNDSATGNRATVAMYDGSSGSGISWAQSTNGGQFSVQTADTGTPALGAHSGLISSFHVVGSPNQAVVALSDENRNVYMKRLTLDGVNVAWSSATGGSSAEITQGSNLITSSNFGRLGIALQRSPSLLTIATTSAAQTIYLGPGSTSFVDNTTCTSEADCAGFTLSNRGTADVTVSRIMLTQLGTANLASTSNWTIRSDGDGNPNNGTINTYTGAISGNTITFTISPVLTVTRGTKVDLFINATYGSGATYPSAGQTLALKLLAVSDIDSVSTPTNDELISGSATVNATFYPVITDYTNTTETALDSTNCPNCGGRIFSSSSAQTITVNGFGFGNDPGAANRAAASTNIFIAGAGTNIIPAANVTSWSNTSITFKLDGQVVGDTDADFGVNYGGATAFQVRSGYVLSNTVGFYLFPALTSITSPAGLGPMGAKVYAATDSDGIITLNGTRFGGVQGSSTVSILGNNATVNSWSNTAVTARVPATILDTTYTGSVSLTGSNPSTASSSALSTSLAGFNMRPRLLSITPAVGDQGAAITLTGRHLCPSGCPTGSVGVDGDLMNAPAFSSSNNVQIASTTSDYWNSWNNTTIVTKVASTTPAGTSTVVLVAGGWNAGSLPFNTTIPVGVLDVTALGQFNNAGLSPALAVGASASATTMYFGGTVGGAGVGSSWSRLAVEVEPVGTAFECSGVGYCGSANRIVGNWVSGNGPYNCSDVAQNCAVSISVNEGLFHWQARSEYVNGSTWYYGNWVSFPTPAANAETSADFIISRAPPVISNLTASNIDIAGATISWTTDKSADSLIQMNTSGAFTNDCSVSNGCRGQDATLVISHSSNVSGLTAATVYYYRVKSCDITGNCAWSPVQQYTTLSAARPAKTVFYHGMTYGGTLSPLASTTATFNVTIPETGTAFESIFIDLRGTESTVNVAPTVSVDVNGVASTYNLPNTGTVTPWRLYHRLTSLNLTPGSNAIKITAGTDTTLSGLSADVIITYRYNP